MSKENRVSDERLAELQHIVGMPADGLYVSLPSRDISAALTELQSLRSKPVAGVEVKPLEWKARGKYIEFALTPLGEYTVEYYEERDGCGWEAFRDRNTSLGCFPKDIGAKAAAEADYEARILSALHPNQESGE